MELVQQVQLVLLLDQQDILAQLVFKEFQELVQQAQQVQ
jgi:hypothetical protein